MSDIGGAPSHAAPHTAPHATRHAAPHAPTRGRDRLPVVLWLVAGLAIGASTWLGAAALHPDAANRLQIVNRWLVRVGLPFFLAAFVASPLARLRPSAYARRLVRERRGIGVAWAMIHLTHATAVLVLFRADAESIPPAVVLIVGGAGFALTAAMAVTSNDASQRMLGRGWGRLHRTGIWYLAFIYAYTYLGRVLEAPTAWPMIALSMLLAIAGLRAVAWQRRRRRRAPAVASAAEAR